MTQDDVERLIEAARGYNDPPETPREEMWAVIREGLPRGRDELAERRADRRDRVRRWTPWAVGLAAAATLVVGFGLGRLTREPTPIAPVAEAAARHTSLPARVAAAEHMSNAEALLTLFRAASQTGDRAATADWARELLATTRMLLDSRVAGDPEMAVLLADLELVLVQIASADGAEDDDLIEDGIRRQQLLAKLRTAAAPADISL
jgi:hypothetical protein